MTSAQTSPYCSTQQQLSALAVPELQFRLDIASCLKNKIATASYYCTPDTLPTQLLGRGNGSCAV